MKPEHYIPFDKEFLLDQQLALYAGDSIQLKKLFELIEHYYHFQAFELGAKIKKNYSLFDPDLQPKERDAFMGKSDMNLFKQSLLKVLGLSNYTPVPKETLDQAFKNSDLIGLRLSIDLDIYKDYALFVRGQHKSNESIRKFFFWNRKLEIDYYDRAFIYLRYQDAAYFDKHKTKKGQAAIEPGTIVLKIFKRVPKNDLETLFPNAIPRMSLTDKLLLWVPGIGGAISLLSTKVIPALISMQAAYKSGEAIDLLNSKTSLNQGLIALGILGAYLFRQWSNFSNKKIRYSKMLSDSLYFKNLGNNSGAFYSLLHSSEEEVLKETILAYCFLLRSNTALSAQELDEQIEYWFRTTLKTELDFDVMEALEKLNNSGLALRSDGKWKVISVEQALQRMDEIWDGIFEYKPNQQGVLPQT